VEKKLVQIGEAIKLAVVFAELKTGVITMIRLFFLWWTVANVL